MTMETAQPGSWHSRSLWMAVVLVFVLQVGLIFWLGDNRPIYPRRPAPSPLLQLAGNTNSEFLTLTDPTLLALPHEQGLSALAWLRSQEVTNEAYHPREKEKDWTEDPQWLVLSVDQLGGGLNRIAATNDTVSLVATAVPEPALFSSSVDSRPAGSGISSFRIEGALAQWRLLQTFDLPSWPARFVSATDTDLLTNSVVQVMVDAQGRPLSATLLTSSGSANADVFALEQARSSRFEPPGGADPNAVPSANPLFGLCWGRLVFEWYTVPATNRPAAAAANP